MKLAIKTILLLVVLVTGLSIRITYAQTNKADRALIADSHLNEFDDYMSRLKTVGTSEVNFKVPLNEFLTLGGVIDEKGLDTLVRHSCDLLHARVESTDSVLADFKEFAIRVTKENLGYLETKKLGASIDLAFSLEAMSAGHKTLINALECDKGSKTK